MLYLSIDTATSLGSVALGDGDAPIGEIVIGDRRQAAAVVPAIDELLRVGGRRWSDLDGVILGDGPGSFTGLRIAFATVQGLVRQRPNVRVWRAPSLLGAAWGVRAVAEGPVAALYDALRGEVFAAVYDFAGGAVRVLLAPTLTTPAALCATGLRPVLAVGDGAALHAGVMTRWTGRSPLGPPLGAPRASSLLALVNITGAAISIDDPASAEPQYGRAAEAQVRWERTHGRPLPHPPGPSR